MRILVAGATGAVGSRLVQELAAAGNMVVGLTRTPEKVETLRGAGAEGRVVDPFDRNAVRAVILDARPEVVVHEMTAIANPATSFISTAPSQRPTGCAPKPSIF